jgi:hypothetical protein
MADLWDNGLVNPSFRNDPPLKLNVPARVMGIISLVLGILGALGALFGAFVSFTWSASGLDSFCGYYNTCATHSTALAGLGNLIELAGCALIAFGGLQMMNGQPRGRALIIYGVVLALVGSLIYSIFWGFGYAAFGLVFSLVWRAIFLYFVIIARFPGEVPLVASTAAPGGGYPPQQYPPQQGYQQPPQAYPQQAPPAQAPPQAPPQQPYPPQQPPAPPGPPV